MNKANLSMTPEKLLEKPKEFVKPRLKMPSIQIASFPFKIPKKLISTQSAEMKSKKKAKKDRLLKNIPLFLHEYIYGSEFELNKNSPKHSKQLETIKNRSLTPSYLQNIKKNFNKSITPVIELEEKKNGVHARPRKCEIKAKFHEEKIKTSENFNKSNVFGNSPIDYLRARSSNTLNKHRINNNSNYLKKKIKRFQKNFKNNSSDQSPKALPVVINHYTKLYADKIKKVIEICEQAKSEVFSLIK